MFCLVRTDPEARKQEGISVVLVDMKTPGITVRKIELLDGEHEVNEVFFDNVRVPVSQRVGEENKGWTWAKYLPCHERTGAAAIGASKAHYASLESLARRLPGDDGGPLIEDPAFRDRLAQVQLEILAAEKADATDAVERSPLVSATRAHMDQQARFSASLLAA